MTREEAARVLEALYGNWDPIEEINWQALRKAIEVLRGPVPDHETGLVRCGCGGKAVLHDENKVSCNKCGITTLEQFTQDDARNDWNTAMGWRGK
jgi:hypothetical protein